MTKLIISVSGLRGIVGETLTPPVIARYVAAFCDQLEGSGPVILARDGRTSGSMLRDVVAGTLAACGRDVWDAGVAATPTVGVLVQAHSAAGAVQISASHNPPQYNGIKLFSPSGRVLDGKTGAAVREQYQLGAGKWQPTDQLGTVEILHDAHAVHMEKVLATVDVDLIRKQSFRVLLDSNHGSGGLLGRRLLESLGCELVMRGGEPTGKFAHPPEPIAENLKHIGEAVRDAGAVVGFCQDPDADRLALVDAAGRYVGEEYTVALCVKHQLAKRPGPIVINLATSSMSEQLAADAGVPCYRSAVGEANVADMMIEQEAVYGGEGNGGPIDPRVGLVRDSFVGMAQLLELLAESGQSLATLADDLPHYQIVKAKTELDRDQLPSALDSLEQAMNAETVSRSDGLRLQWASRWLLVRGSNTEPIVRFIAEAPSKDEAKRLCDEAEAIVKGSGRP